MSHDNVRDTFGREPWLDDFHALLELFRLWGPDTSLVGFGGMKFSEFLISTGLYGEYCKVMSNDEMRDKLLILKQDNAKLYDIILEPYNA